MGRWAFYMMSDAVSCQKNNAEGPYLKTKQNQIVVSLSSLRCPSRQIDKLRIESTAPLTIATKSLKNSVKSDENLEKS
jgi:hypothetical protein